MNLANLLIIVVIGVISFFICRPISKATKIPLVLFLIFIGVILGPYVLKLYSVDAPISKTLSVLSTFSVIMLFLVSGLGLNVQAIVSSGKKTLGLSFFPVIIEGFIMGIVTYLIFLILPIEIFKFSLFGFLMIMAVFAMSSPAIIIPLTLKAKAEGKKDPIYDEMTIASVLDNFIPLPLVILYLNITVAVAAGSSVNVGDTLEKVILAIVSAFFAYFIGHVVGLIISFFNKINTIPPIVIGIILMIATVLTVMLTGKLGVSYGILIGFGVGLGYNIHSQKAKELEQKVSQKSSLIYTILFMPLIFIYVGTQMQLELLTIMTVISLAFVTVLAVVIKGKVSSFYLKKMGSTEDERKLSGTLFAAKGVILINISLVLSGTLKAAGLDNLLQFMYILAVVATLLSFTYSILASEKLLKKMN